MRPGRLCVLLLAAVAAGACEAPSIPARAIAGADPGQGRAVAQAIGCGACHQIPGVDWPRGRVGPSLEGFGGSPLIAGQFPNEPETLVRWLRNAPSMSPGTGMPPIPLSEQEARDVAAYLYTLDAR